MAKSLRSKWKRKMRAVKRVNYGARENAKLVKMLDSYKKEQEEEAKDEEGVKLHKPQVLGAPAKESATEDKLDPMDTTTEKQKHSMKSLKNEHGSYPAWMSNRKIQQQKSKGKKQEGKVNKRHKKKYL